MAGRLSAAGKGEATVSVSVQEQAIIMSLEPLFEEATAKGLWFFHESSEAGEVWCSPEFLRLEQSKGKLIWAPEHWELRSPTGYIKTLRIKAEQCVAEFNELSGRFGLDKRLDLSETAAEKD